MAGDAAAELGPHLAEREVDLVVESEDPVERDSERPAGGSGRVPGLVHERLRKQDRDARAAGPDPAAGDEPSEPRLRPRQLPAGAERVGDLESGVVPGPGVAAAGIAESDHEEVGGAGARPRAPTAATAAEPAQN